MIGISELFKRIQGLRARDIVIRTAIQEAIKKQTGADISLESVSFSSDSAVLKDASSALKSAIFIKKSAILAEINAAQSMKKIVDIR